MTELLGCGSVFWQAHIASHIDHELFRFEEERAAVVVEKKDDAVELIAHGEPDSLPRAIQAAKDAGIPAPTWAMLTRDTPLSSGLKNWLPPYWGNGWDFFWTDRPLAVRPGAERVQRISAAEARPVVVVANPRSEALDAFDRYRWYGLPDGNGIGAVLGALDEKPVNGKTNSYIGGLGTLPDRRGKGLGGAIMTGVTNRELETHGILTFGMWAENPARSLYNSLGYIHGGAQIIADSKPFGPH